MESQSANETAICTGGAFSEAHFETSAGSRRLIPRMLQKKGTLQEPGASYDPVRGKRGAGDLKKVTKINNMTPI